LADNLEEVKAWLLVRKSGLRDIDLDLDLINNRIIDSLDLIEFLCFLSGVTGRDLLDEMQSRDEWPDNHVRTLRLIRDNILNISA